MSVVTNEMIAQLALYFAQAGAPVTASQLPTIPISKLNVDIATQAELEAGIGGVTAQVAAVSGTANSATATAASNAALINSLTAALNALTSRVSTLETEMDAAEARITALEGLLAAAATQTIGVDEFGAATGFSLTIEDGLVKTVAALP